MTLREKLEIEHPECIDEKWHGGCKDCPHTYGYCAKEDCLCDMKTCTDELCRECWDQQYKGELTPQEKTIKELKDKIISMEIDSRWWKNSYVGLREHMNITAKNIGAFCYGTDTYTLHKIEREYEDLKGSRNRWRRLAITFFVAWLIVVMVTLCR